MELEKESLTLPPQESQRSSNGETCPKRKKVRSVMRINPPPSPKPKRPFATEDLSALIALALRILKLSTPTVDLSCQEEGDPDLAGDEEILSRSRGAGSIFSFPKIFIQGMRDEWEEPIHPRFHVAQAKKHYALPASTDNVLCIPVVDTPMANMVSGLDLPKEGHLRRLQTTGAMQPFIELMRLVPCLLRFQLLHPF
ncbi:UNVERIFIED_CONTAM: hypothetical protein K2H54_038245 [Gekko kuhli]